MIAPVGPMMIALSCVAGVISLSYLLCHTLQNLPSQSLQIRLWWLLLVRWWSLNREWLVLPLCPICSAKASLSVSVDPRWLLYREWMVWSRCPICSAILCQIFHLSLCRFDCDCSCRSDDDRSIGNGFCYLFVLIALLKLLSQSP